MAYFTCDAESVRAASGGSLSAVFCRSGDFRDDRVHRLHHHFNTFPPYYHTRAHKLEVAFIREELVCRRNPSCIRKCLQSEPLDSHKSTKGNFTDSLHNIESITLGTTTLGQMFKTTNVNGLSCANNLDSGCTP